VADTSRVPEPGRTVVTTRTDGWLELRYAPRQPTGVWACPMCPYLNAGPVCTKCGCVWQTGSR
jgi:hypothetical protein